MLRLPAAEAEQCVNENFGSSCCVARLLRRAVQAAEVTSQSNRDGKRLMALHMPLAISHESRTSACVCIRPISTGKLKASQPLHLRPINQVIYLGPGILGVMESWSGGVLSAQYSNTPLLQHPGLRRRPYLEVRFALRCFQRLSRTDLVTQRCPWRDNWYALGRPAPFLP